MRTYFWVMQMSCFVQKIVNMHSPLSRCNTISPVIKSTTFLLPGKGSTTPPQLCWLLSRCFEFWLSIEATDYQSIFAKTILFENCSCFSKIPFSISMESPRIFQCLISIPAGHWVRQIRQRSTSPILLVSFIQPCDQHDRKIRTIRKSAARWHGHRARGYRKLVLRENLLYVPNFKM